MWKQIESNIVLTVGLNTSSPKKFFGGLWGLKPKKQKHPVVIESRTFANPI